MASTSTSSPAQSNSHTVDSGDIEARARLLASYLSPAELVQVRQRMLEHAGDWLELIEQAKVHMVAGTAPHDATMQELARRWAALFRASYAGDDDALDGKVRSAFDREPGLSANIDIGLATFMQRALMHLYRLPDIQDGARDESPKPSARMTATLRAAHQLLDVPLILDDPLALKIMGPAQEAELRANPGRYRNPFYDVMRAMLAVRSRLAEDTWLQALHNGMRQYVILGAGLDTFAYRSGATSDTRLFEVDLPSTQRWKRACLRVAGIAEPASLHYVATDFTHTTLGQALAASGFDPDLPATFSWLGVTTYLNEEDVMETLRYVATCSPGSCIVFDYLITPELLTPIERTGLEVMAEGLAAQGEALHSHFDPPTLEHSLRQLGFRKVEHFGPETLSEQYLAGRSDGLRVSGALRMIRATV
ncbi:MAG: hypothetical protein JWP34_1415 [Massilia sp.]|jgi:methyltransferase (TIGR00027 family)|nr:hypothetical protein [Massilia sp.]